MAKQMSFVHPETGARHTASYWTPMRLEIDLQTNRVMVTMGGYANRTAREEGRQPIAIRHWSVEGPAFMTHYAALLNDMKGRVYGHVGGDRFFEGAQDV